MEQCSDLMDWTINKYSFNDYIGGKLPLTIDDSFFYFPPPKLGALAFTCRQVHWIVMDIDAGQSEVQWMIIIYLNGIISGNGVNESFRNALSSESD